MIEFSRLLDIKRQLSKHDGHVDICANEAECATLAKRFSFHSIGKIVLKGLISERKNDKNAYIFNGILSAEYIKEIDENAPESMETIQEDIALLLCKREPESLNFDDMDFEIIEHGSVDFGEVVAQYLYLSTDLLLDNQNSSVYTEEESISGPFDHLKTLL